VVFPEQDRGVLRKPDPVGISIAAVDTGHQVLTTDRGVNAAEIRGTGMGDRIHDDRVHNGVWLDHWGGAPLVFGDGTPRTG
jgi:hypothetical protein